MERTEEIECTTSLLERLSAYLPEDLYRDLCAWVHRLSAGHGSTQLPLFEAENVAQTPCRVLESSEAGRDWLRLVIHDFRAPLQVLTSAAELLRERLSDRAQEQACVEQIQRSAHVLGELVDELMELPKLEAGSVRLELHSEDVRQLIERAIAYGVRPHHRRRIRVHGPTVRWPLDRRRMERVVLNLLTNALEISPHDTPIDVQVVAEGGLLRISVQDQGPGLTEAQARRLFNKGVTFPSGGRAGGHGLGLYMCRLIAEAHGGHVDVSTTAHRGARFTVWIPHCLERSRCGAA